MLVFLIAVGAVALFVLGLSLTLIFKGHHIKGEVGENDEMKKRGLKCAAQEMREDDAALRGEPFDGSGGCATDSCGSCDSKCNTP